MGAYLGVDISQGRWAGVLLGAGRDVTDAALVADDIATLVERAQSLGQPQVIAIDVPIDPPVAGVRACDTEARAALPGRGSTLFTTPSLAALEVASRHGFSITGYDEALEANREAQGRGMSRQAYGLAAKILDVRDWVAGTGAAGIPVIECHPELSFAHLVNPRDPKPPRFGKKTWEGMRQRIRLLHGAGIDVQYVRDGTGLIGADDLVDAAACAWTARRFAAGNAVRFPARSNSEESAAEASGMTAGAAAAGPAIWA